VWPHILPCETHWQDAVAQLNPTCPPLSSPWAFPAHIHEVTPCERVGFPLPPRLCAGSTSF
jgi:hypothetical protein